MRLNKEELEKLATKNFDADTMNTIFENVKHNMNQVLNDYVASEILKYPIEVNFYLNQNIKDDPTACVKKIDKNRYNIIIGKKLLTLVNHYAHKIVDSNYIYKEVDRIKENKDKLLALSSAVFYFWMDFICLHEYFHIVKGHLEYDNKSYSKDDIFVEVEADRLAIKFLTGKFSIAINEFKKEVNLEEKALIENYVISMIYLFDLFFLLNEETKRDRHPLPIERIVIILTSIIEFQYEENRFRVSQSEFNNLVMEASWIYISHHGSEYKINRKEFTKKMFEVILGHQTFLKDRKFKNHEILK